MELRIIPNAHVCYILRSKINGRIYIGYTVDFERRLRQHNGEIIGGAKKTSKHRPWEPLCVISGFYDNSTALRFEFRLQHPRPKKKPSTISPTTFVTQNLQTLINKTDGVLPWPYLLIKWYDPLYKIHHANVINNYINLHFTC